mmetsp:Transcript_34187/g.80497  ORF Transcript_34187/g.80497 Transcript_34187/m.80497 type:complete len:493 (-) Transcript_34187:1333-2811(-)
MDPEEPKNNMREVTMLPTSTMAAYTDDSQLSSSISRIGAMRRNEQTTYAHRDYISFGSRQKQKELPGAASSSSSPEVPCSNTGGLAIRNYTTVIIDPSCRYLMARWCTRLCRFCECDNIVTTAATVMSCVDQFLATNRHGQQQLHHHHPVVDTDRYQLIVVAAWYLVTKIRQPFAVDLESMQRLSHGKYSPADIEGMEVELLMTLGWKVHPPTPTEFAHEYVNLLRLPVDSPLASDPRGCLANEASLEERLLELIDCQLEEVVSDYELSCRHRPSHVAFGALWNALVGLGLARDLGNNEDNSNSNCGREYCFQDWSWNALKERLLGTGGGGSGIDATAATDDELQRSVGSIRALLGMVAALGEGDPESCCSGRVGTEDCPKSSTTTNALLRRSCLALLVDRCCHGTGKNCSSSSCNSSQMHSSVNDEDDDHHAMEDLSVTHRAASSSSSPAAPTPKMPTPTPTPTVMNDSSSISSSSSPASLRFHSPRTVAR